MVDAKTMPRLPLKTGSPDDFQTPVEALDILLPYLTGFSHIWECAAGKGNLAGSLKREGYEVTSTDKDWDFLSAKGNPADADVIVTNPPYSIKNEFLERAYERCLPFAFLLPLSTLESKRRQRLFARYGIEIVLPAQRYHFETPTGRSGKSSSSWFATAWFCHGIPMPRQLMFCPSVMPERQAVKAAADRPALLLNTQKIADARKALLAA